MARAIWSGSVSFGLLSVPVKLINAVSRKSVSFNQLEATTGARVKQKLVSGVTGDEVRRDEIVKGYNVGGDLYVVVTEDDLAALMPKAQRSIDLQEFVDLDEIDPVFYDAAYYLVPDEAAVKPYRLLAEAMASANKVGIARFVMRSKEYVGALRAHEGRLLLSTMVYADELNDISDVPEFDKVADIEISERELAMAEQLIESLSADFEPEKYHDTYREEVFKLIEAKANGEERIEAPVAVADEKVVDLLAALEASVASAKAARERHPTALAPDAAQDADEQAPAKRTRAKSA